MEQMENLLLLVVPILKHITVTPNINLFYATTMEDAGGI